MAYVKKDEKKGLYYAYIDDKKVGHALTEKVAQQILSSALRRRR